METIGFIGLGRMGSPIALNIQKAGYPMIVFDAQEDATRAILEGGARLGASPSDVAAQSDFTFTSLPGPKQVEEVVEGKNGILEGIKKGAVYLDLTTCGPDLVRRLEGQFRQRGARLMDTPVISSPTRALDRSTIVMAGGEREVFDLVQPILDAFADKVIYTGDLGTACICKLINNMMSFTTQQVLAEGLTLGIKAGVDLDVLMDTGSRDLLGTRKGMYRTVFRGQFQPTSFSLKLALKDVALSTELGRENNVPMPMVNLTEQLFRQGVNRGWGEDDYSSAVKLQEEAAGIEVRSSGNVD